MLTRALILAAGKGIAVGDQPGPNCLATVGGVTLIERTLTVLEAIGIRQIAITTGWRGAELRAAIADSTRIPASIKRSITYFDNPHWDKPNGLSVQAARAFLTERTLLVMADQIAAPALLRELVALPSPPDRTVLCVDRDLARVFDIEDATKVQLAGDAVRAIGKDLRQYQAISAGLFVMSPTLLAALDSLEEPSLTQGVAAAAARGLVGAHDVGTKLWQDVDSPAMKGHADWLLRVYGGELASPSVPAAEHSHAGDTLALVDRLLAEKDLARARALQPGPGDDVGARESGAGAPRRLPPRRGLFRGRRTPAVEAAAGLRRVGRARDAAAHRLGDGGDGDGDLVGDPRGQEDPGRQQRRVRRPPRRDRGAARHRARGVALSVGRAARPAAVARALASDADIAGVAMIHHETSVGLLNPVREIGRLCHARGVTLIVDAVSALGAEDVDVVRDHVDICYSSANKCLHSVSGVSFLCVAPAVWSRVAEIRPRVYYLDLKRHRRYLEELRQTPFTPAVSSFFALETALDELAEGGGVPARRAVYRERALRIRRVFTDLGFEQFTHTGRESHTISTLRLPDFLTVDGLYRGLKQRGFVIYGCKGQLAARHVQVANMGEIPDTTLDAFLAAVTEVVAAARPARKRPDARIRTR